MKTSAKRFLSLLLTLILLTGCAPWAAASSAEKTARLTELPWPSADGVHADVSFADMEWVLYDMTEFDARAGELSETESLSRAEELYSWLLTEYKRIQTLDELAWIDYYANGGEEASSRCQTTDELLSRASDALYAAVSRALAGAVGEKFSDYLGQETSDSLADYEEMTDRELELQNRETELKLAYNELLDRTDLSVKKRGKKAGEILLELIAVRNELAEIYGYDSFADYAYENYYGRDFTPADADELCQAIHSYARTYFADCCYCDAFYTDLGGEESWDREELLALLRTYAPRISKDAAEAEKYMEEHGLYLLGDSEEIADLGFTVTLEYYNAPFLYKSLDGSLYDLQGLFHEFGHYYDAFVNRSPNPLADGGSYDIFEIHSTGLEALSYFWYDEIFDEALTEAQIYRLDDLMYGVFSGCLYDEFQRYIYAHPDLTVEELCDVYVELREAYGDPIWDDDGRWDWVDVSHNFESPFYYISYAVSALASLQIWTVAEEDFDAALEYYLRLVDLGAYRLGYCELLREVGLSVFTDDLDECIAEPLRVLRRMCLRYDGRSGANEKIK